MMNANEIANCVIRGDFKKVEQLVRNGNDMIQPIGGNTPYEISILCRYGHYSLFSNNYPPPEDQNFEKITDILERVTPDNIKWMSIKEMLDRNQKYSLNKTILTDPYLSFVQKLDITAEFKQLLLSGDTSMTKMIAESYPEYINLRKQYLEKKSRNSWTDMIKAKLEIAFLEHI